MKRANTAMLLAVAALLAASLAGCVERKLTINTEPPGAVVMLNDEEIGTSPVTVNFTWYGDYKVRIEKAGYETLNTHRKLDAPPHDKFPMDFFAETLSPKRIVDHYEWHFDLKPFEPVAREQLLEDAENMRYKAVTELLP